MSGEHYRAMDELVKYELFFAMQTLRPSSKIASCVLELASFVAVVSDFPEFAAANPRVAR